MRIGIDATAVLDELSGVEVVVHTTVDALARHGGDDEVVLFVRRRAPSAWRDLPERFHVDALPTDSQAVATQVLLPAAARRAGVDVLYCPARPAPAMSGRPVLAAVHDVIPWTRPDTMGRGAGLWYRSFHRIAVRRGAHVAAGCQAAGQELVRVLGLSPDRLHVVAHALAPWLAQQVDRPLAWPAVAGQEGSRYLLSVCRIEPRKDLATVLAAWQQLAGGHPDLRLLLAGKIGWKVDEVIETARSLPRVELLGSVSNDDLAGLYRHAAAFVTASREEGFGLPVLEAMAMGTPVVASAISPHAEVGGGAAALFRPGDPGGLATAVDAIVGDPAEGERRRQAGRLRADHYSAARLAERLGDALKETAG